MFAIIGTGVLSLCATIACTVSTMAWYSHLNTPITGVVESGYADLEIQKVTGYKEVDGLPDSFVAGSEEESPTNNESQGGDASFDVPVLGVGYYIAPLTNGEYRYVTGQDASSYKFTVLEGGAGNNVTTQAYLNSFVVDGELSFQIRKYDFINDGDVKTVSTPMEFSDSDIVLSNGSFSIDSKHTGITLTTDGSANNKYKIWLDTENKKLGFETQEILPASFDNRLIDELDRSVFKMTPKKTSDDDDRSQVFFVNAANWSGAQIGCYYWGDGITSSWEAGYEGFDDDFPNMYRFEIPARATKCIFLRMDSAQTYSGGYVATGFPSGVWNQSGDITIESNKVFAASGYSGSTLTGSWQSWNRYLNRYYLRNGVKGDQIDTLNLHYGDVLTAVSDVSKTGFDFNGWFWDTGKNYQLSKSSRLYGNKETQDIYGDISLATYTISYNLDGGTVDGSNPTSYTFESSSITLINPTKDGFVFSGWTGSNGVNPQTSVTIPTGSTGNKSYTAVWEQVAFYRVTLNVASSPNNGGTLSCDYVDVPDGTIVSVANNVLTFTYSGNVVGTCAPTPNANDEQYTYSFSSWSQTSGTITDATTITASFSRAERRYTVYWKDGDGNTLKTVNDVLYSTATSENYALNTYDRATPTKTSTNTTVYTFNNTWSYGGADTLSNPISITFTAQFNSGTRYYSVSLNNNGGTGSSSVDTVTYGDAMPTVSVPTKDNFTFTGYYLSDGTTKYYNSDGTYAHVYNDNAVTDLYAHWVVNNGFYLIGVLGGETDWDATSASNWIKASSHDASTVVWDSVPLTDSDHFKVVYWNGASFSWKNGGFGAGSDSGIAWTAPYASNNIGCTAAANYRVTLTSRDDSLEQDTSSKLSFGRIYTATLNAKDQNGDVSSSNLPIYSDEIYSAPSMPTITGYDKSGWRITGYDGSEYSSSRPAGNLVLFHSYSLHTYQITYNLNNGVNSGNNPSEFFITSSAIVFEDPTREGYIFRGWYGNSGLTGDQITGVPAGSSADVTVWAKWEIKKYTITWKNGNVVLETDQNVEHGTIPTYDGETPTKTATAQYTYEFSGWSPAIVAATGDQVYLAQFSSTLRSYNITWLQDDGSEIEVTVVNYGETPSHADPSKESVQYVYEFTGWSPAIVPVVGDATYTASYSSSTRQYTITWVDGNGDTLKTDEVDYGDTPEYSGSTPTKAATAQYSYTFTGWSPTIVPVVGTATYTATFDSVTRTYTIVWQNYDGTTLETDEQVPYGSTPSYNGSQPQKSTDNMYSYSFYDWDPAITSVTGNATYTATFTRIGRVYSVTFVLSGGAIREGEDFDEYTCGVEKLLPVHVYKSGASFGGWKNANEVIVTSISNETYGNLVFTAVWGPKNTFFDGDVVYFSPSENWRNPNNPARFAIYVSDANSNETLSAWADMEAVSGVVNVFKAVIPEGEWPYIKFVRMNPNTSENNWNNKWADPGSKYGETDYLTYDFSNGFMLYDFTSHQNKDEHGSWKSFTEEKITVYFYDNRAGNYYWSVPRAYVYKDSYFENNGDAIKNANWSGELLTRVDNRINGRYVWKITFYSVFDRIIFNNNNDSEKTEGLTGFADGSGFVMNTSHAGTWQANFGVIKVMAVAHYGDPSLEFYCQSINDSIVNFADPWNSNSVNPSATIYYYKNDNNHPMALVGGSAHFYTDRLLKNPFTSGNLDFDVDSKIAYVYVPYYLTGDETMSFYYVDTAWSGGSRSYSASNKFDTVCVTYTNGTEILSSEENLAMQVGPNIFRILMPAANYEFKLSNGNGHSTATINTSDATSAHLIYINYGSSPRNISWCSEKDIDIGTAKIHVYSLVEEQLVEKEGSPYIMGFGGLTYNYFIYEKGIILNQNDVFYIEVVDAQYGKDSYVYSDLNSASQAMFTQDTSGKVKTSRAGRYTVYITNESKVAIAEVPILGNGYYIMTKEDNGGTTSGYTNGVKMVSSEDGNSATFRKFYASSSYNYYIRSYLDADDEIYTNYAASADTKDIVTVTNGVIKVSSGNDGYFDISIVDGLIQITRHNARESDFFKLNGLSIDPWAASIKDQKTSLVLEIEFTLKNNAPVSISLTVNSTLGFATYCGCVLYVGGDQLGDAYREMRYYHSSLSNAVSLENINDGFYIAPSETVKTYYAYVLVDYLPASSGRNIQSDGEFSFVLEVNRAEVNAA